MNEGFGTYSDYLYTESFRGEIEAALDINGKKNSYLREANNRYKRPIVFTRYNRPQDNFDSHTYPKAASVLHMLRFLIGDEAFFKTLSHFLHKHEFGVVDTHDFMVSVKESTGKNMDWFFEQWIYKPGHPVFEVSKEWNAEKGELKLRIAQVQDTVNGIPVFSMPVKIGLYKEGEDPLFEGLWLDERVEEFSWTLPAEPDMVRFDEGNILLKEWTYQKEINELEFQIKNDDVIGRIWAIEQLDGNFDNKLSNEITSLLENSVTSDSVWAVRLAALDCLFRMNGVIDQAVLLRAINDDHHRVRSRAKRILEGE
jgi:aminopeptidase N